jgi:exopolyphosphatase/guanosine-5'-triphosphate,3'-diphosphate pyrophosphatase
MLQGVLSALPEGEGPCLVVDIGGWSTEIVWAEGGEAKRAESLAMGAVSLCEGFMRSDPPAGAEIGRMDGKIHSMLKELRCRWEEGESESFPAELVGTAGTMTTLAAIDLGTRVYDPRRINGHRIGRARLDELYERLQKMTVRERREIAGLEAGREELIVAGAAVAVKLLEAFSLSGLTVIDSGLLEGVLLEGMKAGGKGENGRKAGKE